MSSLLNEAAQALGRGDFTTAVKLAEACLVDQPGSFDVRHLLGIALCQSGDIQAGRIYLDQAMAQQPSNPDPHYNLGNVQLEQGALEDAEVSLREAIRLAPQHYSAWNSLGILQMQAGATSDAARSFQMVVNIEPRHAAAYRGLGAALCLLDDTKGAESAYRESLHLQPSHPTAIQGMGALLFEQGRLTEVHEMTKAATTLHPDNVDLCNALGVLELQLSHYDRAAAEFRRGLALHPDSLQLRDNLGVALGNLGDPDGARKCHEAVLAIDPEHPRALANLAELLEMMNDLDAARHWVQTGLAKYPEHPVLNLVGAKCLRRQGEYENALAQLLPVAQGPDDAPYMKAVHFEIGRIRNALGQYDSAYGAFQQGNQLALNAWQKGGAEADPLMPVVRHLLGQFQSSHVSLGASTDWTARPLAFLVGFQRSGTTLLDTILDAHSNLQVIEESPALVNLVGELARSKPYPECLGTLKESEIQALRQQYFAAIERDQPIQHGQMIVDKSPLNSVHLGLIDRLFPGVPVIFMVRHPMDVCLSCFMQDFTLSPFTAQFCRLETTVAAYDQIMLLVEAYRQVLPLNLMTIRYEDLISNFKPQVESVLELLGKEWESGLATFDEHARRRGLIRTPSYHQVSRPIYQSSVERWRHYADFLTQYKRQLEPHTQRFGYPSLIS